MNIFKDEQAHKNLSADLKAVNECFDNVKTRLVEKTLDTLVEDLCQEIWFNLVDDAQITLQDLMMAHPDSEITGMIDLLAFKESVTIRDAKEFYDKIGLDHDESVTQFRVYRDGFYIEVLKDGRHQLVIENRSWIEPETPLETMELELFNYSEAANYNINPKLDNN